MVKKKARDDVRCQLKQRHRQTPTLKIEQPTPHAEAYIASPACGRGWKIQAQRRRFWLPQSHLE